MRAFALKRELSDLSLYYFTVISGYGNTSRPFVSGNLCKIQSKVASLDYLRRCLDLLYLSLMQS
jgi:hypothetical protein